MSDGRDLDALCHRYGAMVLRRCRRLLGNDDVARDVCQDVFLRLIDISDDIKNVDAGLVVGGGLDLPAGRGAFVVDLRGTIGLIDLREDSTPTIKTRAFMALVGYRF